MAELRYKVGDVARIVKNTSFHRFPKGTIVRVQALNHLHEGYRASANGDSWMVNERDLEDYSQDVSIDKTIIKEQAMKAMKDAVLTVAKQLAKANNTVTTLEIKTELRRDYPYYYWTQDVVSNYMSQLAGDGVFNYTDNGIYRTYRLASGTSAPTYTAGSVYMGTPAVATAVANKSVGILSGKASSKIAAPIKKRGRPAKATTHISRGTALIQSTHPRFQEVTIKRRTGNITYPLAAIKAQKKSPLAYIKRSLDNVTSIKVDGITYLVK